MFDELQSTEPHQEEVVVEVGNELQPSFKHPPEVFQAAPEEDFLQTSELLPATAHTLETDHLVD